MRKIVIVCLCAALLLALPFTSLAIQPRQLVPRNSPSVPIPDGDPDGPTEGGLDDPSDWNYLVLGFTFVVLTVGDIDQFINYSEQMEFDDPFMLALWMLINGMTISFDSLIAFCCFGEAFDIWDIDEDGC